MPPESLPCVTPGSLIDGMMSSLSSLGQPVGPSLLHVSCRMIMSEFFISELKSVFLLLRPKVDDLRP